jgi:hypothetical protein
MIPSLFPKGRELSEGFFFFGLGSFQRWDPTFSTPHLSPLLDRGGEEILATSGVKHTLPKAERWFLLPVGEG